VQSRGRDLYDHVAVSGNRVINGIVSGRVTEQVDDSGVHATLQNLAVVTNRSS
jgi:hypothetical protein